MVDKVKFCVEASEKFTEGHFIICARTDGYGIGGMKETLMRSKAYIDAGASMIFPEGLTSKEEFQLVAKELRQYKPDILLLANMTEFGKTPYIDYQDFKDWGYNVIIYPVSTLRVANKAIEEFLISLKKNGTQKEFLHKMQTRQELYS